MQIHFKDGTQTEEVECEYPLGHRFRRDEAIPKVKEKFSTNIKTRFPLKQQKQIEAVCYNQEELESMSVNEFVQLFLI